ncbi:hypothetical protein HMN09_01354100 [Mycena chlorophos]|uniref:Uncharacterized protein n=1 Tax=Mycena chlorophos TaxID=658473 RepID=A0A8H6VUU3_MYCCL|nr:hypothetical protein HMN09_01354100 [Mycena chlorophos]
MPYSAFPETTEAAGADNVSETLEEPIDTSRVNEWSTTPPIAAVPPSASSLSLSYSSTLPPPATNPTPTKFARQADILTTILVLIVFTVTDELPRQLYLHFLLRIPSLYFARVTRIFEEARLSLPDIKRMARARADEWDEKNTGTSPTMLFSNPELTPLPRSLLSFKASWDSFIDALLREWNTLNVISVLLMSAILTLLQIDAASHPIIRTTALFSLICALMSLLYGCIYIIRFGTMRKMHKASGFATDAQNHDVGFWWNVWVLLAMPAIWLSWSIITFLASIMSFIWLSGSSSDGTDFVLSPPVALGTRIGLTLVFALGLVYFVLIVREFQRYGDPLDEAWQRAVSEWAAEQNLVSAAAQAYPYGTTPPVIPNTYANGLYPTEPPIIIQPRSLRSYASNSKSSRKSTTRAPYRDDPVSWSRWQPRPDLVPSPPVPRVAPPPAPAQKIELPAAFSRPPSESFGPQPQPIHPTMLVRLGREDDEPTYRLNGQAITLRDVLREDLDRFMSDVSSAWRGELVVLTRKTGDDTVLNSLVQPPPPPPPPRPDAPIPPSPVDTDTRSWSRSLSASPEVRNPNDARPLAAITEESANLSASSLPMPPGTKKLDRDGEVQSQSPTRVEFAGVGTSRSILSDTRSRAQTVRTASSGRPAQAQAVQDLLDLWNARYFSLRHFEVVMDRPGPSEVEPAPGADWPLTGTPEFVIVLRSRSPDKPAEPAIPNNHDHEQPTTTVQSAERASLSGSADVGSAARRSLASGVDDTQTPPIVDRAAPPDASG